MNRIEFHLWLLHRVTGMALALFVIVHLITIITVIQNGLSAEEILGRTRGNIGLAVFYGLFAVFASVHGALGLRIVAKEWAAWQGRRVDTAVIMFGTLLTAIGLTAVVGLVR